MLLSSDRTCESLSLVAEIVLTNLVATIFKAMLLIMSLTLLREGHEVS